MSFDYNNTNWVAITAADATADIMTRINTILSSNGITNLLKPVISNVVYIFCLAVGQIRAVYDQLLYQAQNSLSVNNCSNDQIENLLPIVGTAKIVGTYTTVWLKVIATSGGSCVVPKGTLLQYNSTITFATLNDLTVLASATGYVRAQCNTLGNIAVLDGQLTSFTTTITYLASVINGTFTVSSVLCGTVRGRLLETATQVRQRILNGNVIDNSLNGFIRALQGIQGLGSVNVIYNADTASPLVLTVSTGSLSIPPRQMWILAQDEDLTGTAVAEAWLQNSLIQTFNSGRGSTIEQLIETYVGQELSVYYDTMTTEDVYVRVNVPASLNPLSDANKLIIENMILTLNNFYSGGGQVTSVDLNNLFAGFNTVKIYGCDVSLTGSGWADYCSIYSDAVPLFSIAKISFNYI